MPREHRTHTVQDTGQRYPSLAGRGTVTGYSDVRKGGAERSSSPVRALSRRVNHHTAHTLTG